MKTAMESLGFARLWKPNDNIYTIERAVREFHCSHYTAKKKMEEAVKRSEWITGYIRSKNSIAKAYAMKGTKVEFE